MNDQAMTTEQVIAECTRLAPDFWLIPFTRPNPTQKDPDGKMYGWDSGFTMAGKPYQAGIEGEDPRLATERSPFRDQLARMALETLQRSATP